VRLVDRGATLACLEEAEIVAGVEDPDGGGLEGVAVRVHLVEVGVLEDAAAFVGELGFLGVGVVGGDLGDSASLVLPSFIFALSSRTCACVTNLRPPQGPSVSRAFRLTRTGKSNRR
jgi:hypothetical protein